MVVYTRGRLTDKRIRRIVVQDGVRAIDNQAFKGCPNIHSMTIPNSVTWIGFQAFQRLENLETIDIPESVDTIWDAAFEGCTLIKTIVIPEGVTNIKALTFRNCCSLKSIKLPKSLTKIDENAFLCCAALEQVEIPTGVEVIGTRAFYGCRSLQSICIPNGIKIIANALFYYCTSLQTVTLPPTIEEFGVNAFRGCVNLENFVIPNGLPALKDGFDPLDVGFDLNSGKVVKQILENASNLTRITLHNHRIKDDDLPKILEWVSACPTLREVDLSYNNLSVGVFEKLASQDIPGHLRLLEIKDQYTKWEEASSSPEHFLCLLDQNPKLVIKTDKGLPIFCIFWFIAIWTKYYPINKDTTTLD